MKVLEIWRYPVKSMGGERIDSAAIGELGIPGDRAFALREDGNTRGAKKFPMLMDVPAYYENSPTADNIPEPMIELKGQGAQAALDPGLSHRISELVGRDVRIERAAPSDDLAFYQRKEKRTLEESRAAFGLVEGEPLPDLSNLPERVMQFANPPGTFFDCYPLLIMTTSSLAALAAAAPDSVIDIRRFRPNILIETNEPGFIESEWAGRTLKIGTVEIALAIPCPRCVMTTIGFADLPKDPGIMRTLVKTSDHNLGVYAETSVPGEIRVGDEAILV